MGGSDIRAWETADPRAAGTSSAAPSAGTSGASGAMGADSTRRCSSWPHKNDWAREMRALLPPFSAEGGMTAVFSFLFFAEDAVLINQGRVSGNNKYRQG